jgi:hypothetical protein
MTLLAALVTLLLTACGGGQKPGTVTKGFDERGGRWVSSMVPALLETTGPSEIKLSGVVEQVEIQTAPGTFLTSWVELRLTVETPLADVGGFTRVTLDGQVTETGEASTIGTTWPHYNCRTVMLAGDGESFRGDEADYRADEELGRDDKTVEGYLEYVTVRFPLASIERVAAAQQATGRLCGTNFTIPAAARRGLGTLVRAGSVTPPATVRAQAPLRRSPSLEERQRALAPTASPGQVQAPGPNPALPTARTPARTRTRSQAQTPAPTEAPAASRSRAAPSTQPAPARRTRAPRQRTSTPPAETQAPQATPPTTPAVEPSPAQPRSAPAPGQRRVRQRRAAPPAPTTAPTTTPAPATPTEPAPPPPPSTDPFGPT